MENNISIVGINMVESNWKIILINYVLLALSLYQSVAMLALKSIMEQIAKGIRKFLWEGGNTNSKTNSSYQLAYY
jgi:hypothetical protein